MVDLRLTTFGAGGSELVTAWSFNVIDGELEYEVVRESGAASNSDPSRAPLQEREAWTLTLGAGLLRVPAAWVQFKRLLHAHKIEWLRTVGGRPAWIEFVLDDDTKRGFERVDQAKRLRRAKIRLLQRGGLSFRDFENQSLKLEDFVI